MILSENRYLFFGDHALDMRAALALAACFLVLLIGGGARFAIGLTFRPMVDEFGWARGELGLAVGAYMLVSAVATFIAGRLADRLSPRALLIGGTIIGGVGIGLMSLVTQPWHALVLYGVVFAIGNGIASLVIVGVIVMRIYPGRAGLANAIAISGMSVGQLVMIAVLASLLVQIGWRSGLRVDRHRASAAAAAAARLPGPAGTQRAATASLSLGEAARTRRFWLLLAIYAICGLDDFFVTTHVAAFAQDRGLGAAVAGNLLALMGLTGLAGVIASGLRERPARAGLADGRRVRGAHRRVRLDRGRSVAALDRGLRAGVRRDVPGHGAAHRRVRARELRHEQSRRAHRPDHHGASDLRRGRRLCGRGDLRCDRRLRCGIRGDARRPPSSRSR